ncbi:MAG: ATP-grasp domain-containing protein [Gammaproteobacteria bacterium]
MKKLRVMMLVHYSLVPPEDLKRDDSRFAKYRTEYDVKQTLNRLGHEVRVIGMYDDLGPIRKTIEEWKPHIAFNLLEDFAGNSALDHYVVSYLETLNTPYTGCNPRGLLLGRDKALSKKLLSYHHIKVPDFIEFEPGKKIGRLWRLPFPMIVKSAIEEGSVGIAQASYVENEQQLRERVALLHEKTKATVIAEQYIDGRELYVSVMGNARLEVLPIRELVFDKVADGLPRMATYKVKWDDDYRARWGIEYQFARNLPNGTGERIARLCKRAYRILDLTGYARFDLRLNRDGELYILEANPNPAIATDDEFAQSASKAGMGYEELIQRILTLGRGAARAEDSS